LTSLLTSPGTSAPLPASSHDESQGLAVVSLSPARLALRRYLRHRAAMIATGLLAVITAMVLLAPLIAPFGQAALVGDPKTQRINYLKPSGKYWFGTDSIGHDLYSRILWGGRVSLFIGLAVALSSGIIGTAVGAFAGFRGGRFDDFLMRFTDLFLAFPLLVTLLIVRQLPKVSQKGGPNIWARILGDPGSMRLVITLLTLVAWTATARIVRGVVLSLKEKEFVEAARALGATDRRIIARHLVPNAIGPIMVSMTFTVAAAIGLESTLSYFGFGVQPPNTSWGTLLSDSKNYVTQGKWWLVLFPSMALLLTVLAVNFMGDGLRDALDPKQNRMRA
jgi:peptide/nickel transport system permease protein